MAVETASVRAGLLDSLSTLAASLLAMAHTRLALLAVDLDEGREHLLALLMFGLLAVFALGVGTVLAVLALVLLVDGGDRVLLLAGLAIGFVLGGVLTWQWVLRRARSTPRMFGASLDELAKDRQQLLSKP